jgi:hypothetical protein
VKKLAEKFVYTEDSMNKYEAFLRFAGNEYGSLRKLLKISYDHPWYVESREEMLTTLTPKAADQVDRKVWVSGVERRSVA